MTQKAGNYFTTAYLMLLFGIYPFYMQDGYRDIGTAKYYFLLYISIGALIILGILGTVQIVKTVRERIGSRAAYLIDWDRLSVTDLFVILYATEILISYTLSQYRQEALWGTEGWYMGLMLRLIFCGLYFGVSRFYRREPVIWYVAAAAASVVCLLGILDRFSFYLIPLEIRSPEFISTLGNINWFCGYLSVMMPVAAVLFLFEEHTGRKLLSGVCSGILFAAGFAQGGSSIFLIFGGLFFGLLWFAVYKKRQLADWFLLIAIWGISAQIIRLMRMFFPEGYNYGINTLCGRMTDSGMTIPAVVIGIGGFCVLHFVEERKHTETVRRIHMLTAGGIAAGIFIWLFLTVFHTIVGIPFLGENNGFLLNGQWGNGRGATWWAGLQIFQKQAWMHKLIGIGPDCFAACAYSLPELASYLREYFGNSRLTNAHNEMLTELVNTGILGTSLYIGFFGSSFYRCIRENTEQSRTEGKADFWFYIPVLSMGCYLIHNMVSFAQVLNFPYVILMAAVGEGLIRSGKSSTEQNSQIRNAPIDE